MKRKATNSFLLCTALLVWTAGQARATDGHFLHGVGAINAAMGGAGVAAPTSLLGIYYLNPAGLMAFEGTRIEFGFEMFKPDRSVTSSAGLEGVTASKSEFVPIPAMAFSTAVGERFVIGLGGLGIGGFGVDYPSDPNNPILSARPNGFGSVFSNYSLLRFTPAVAFAATDDLWFGAGFDINWASLTVDPLPVAAPAVDPGPDGQPFTADDRAFYSRATATDGAFGLGFQLGIMYRLSEQISLGAAFTSPQWFQDFEYNSVWENPNLENFGAPRTIQFGLDIPAVVSGGVAVTPMPNLLFAGDFRYIFYDSSDGFKCEDHERPFAEDGSVSGFGWENIWVAALGVQYLPVNGLRLRAGYNHSQNPIPDDMSFFNIPAPGIVEDHLTLGLGFDLTRQVGVDLAYYHAFANQGSGSFWSPLGPVDGTSVTNEMKEDSFLVQFSFLTGGGL